MRAIKGCKGQPLLVSTPRSQQASSQNQTPQPFLMRWMDLQKRKQMLWGCHWTEGWRGGCHLPPLSLRHMEEAAPRLSPGALEAPAACSSGGILLLWEASLWNGNYLHKIIRCGQYSLIQWHSWLFSRNRPNCRVKFGGETWLWALTMPGWELGWAHTNLIGEELLEDLQCPKHN
jgi:hypothetical protein